MLILLLLVFGACDDIGVLTDLAQEGDTGSLPQHIELVRGKFLEHSASVRLVYPDGSALMRCHYAVTASRTDSFTFLIKGVATKGWEKGDVKATAPYLKVTGWHKYKSGGSNVEVPILEPIEKPKEQH